MVTSTGLFTYPDVVVTCGKGAFADDEQDTLLNPLVIFEVLSDATEAYDRGKKFEHYQPSTPYPHTRWSLKRLRESSGT